MPKIKHGASRRGAWTREFRRWIHMRARCYDPKCKRFKDYGGRIPPITVCDRWRHSFENFLTDMGLCPSGMTIDRKDNNGNYEPGNCRWATTKEQNNNKRNNNRLTLNGRTQTASQWSEELGGSRELVRMRLRKGWTVIAALMTRVRR
jgi:hypothetical protein